ncbi:MAG: VTT domain-containing protein [Gammaproteobacteria bacterium]|nr:VTT domain-containing protein [Gammaproteobacteria bacterium]MDX5374555.1 VTT domain-containing protein [Gammaproteobacteria bacterium]
MSKQLTRIALVLVLVAGITLAIVYRDAFDAAALEAWVDNAGAAGPVAFVLIYALATVLFLPGSVLTLAGGALFGPVLGTVLNLTGATLGAALAFLVSRHLASDWVARRTGGRLKQLIQGVESEGWRFVAFVRLVPLFPFNLLNYALGLTRIPFWHYVIASAVCMLPGAIAYTYLGYAGREAIAGGESLIQKILLGIALLAAVAFLPRLVARLRRGPMLDIAALRARLDAGEDVLVLDVRTPEEFTGELGHIAGARNLPLDTVAEGSEALAAWQERPVLLVCRTDRRSARAAQILARRGFADLHVVAGGMEAWNAAGLPVER